ncbi:acyl-CoA carboxylase subunit beta [Arcanobacterium wilhelmae]|nr:acyl-CoA carboxylase subunit beta [Arcanobacterium wilhelmae]WFN91125.1 acyl-CoA carboxylase subunit beta [Arcanobacterium wilhelmae]
MSNQPFLNEKISIDTSDHVADRARFVAQLQHLVNTAEEKAAARQHPKGKGTARERIAALVDSGSFVETGQFMGGNVAEGFSGAAVITGLGRIDGRQVAVYAQDFSVRGGTLGEAEGNKIIAIMQQALKLRIPVIGMLDSGGARIQDGVVALGQYGRIFKLSVEASGVIPQISLILGPCAGGAVYSPALTDFIVMTKANSHMFVTGPDVVRATTGEEVSFADLGGAEVHNHRSGVAHYLADDEADAIDFTRALLSYLPSNSAQAAPHYDYAPEGVSAEVADLVPASSKQPYDMTEVIAQITDYGEFLQVHEGFARSILTGFAAFEGRAVGIVANQPMVDAGTLDVDASEKAARFVQFCDAFNIPVVTLVDVPGYRPGTEQEQAGIIRRGAKLIWSYASATVPLVTVVLRKAYGGAEIVMGSKSLGGDMVYAWPSAEIAVLGADGAVSILHRRELAAAREAGNEAEVRGALMADYTEKNVNPLLSVARGEIDAIIDPDQTRATIVASLAALATKTATPAHARKHGNMPM